MQTPSVPVQKNDQRPENPTPSSDWIALVREKVEHLGHGTLQIVIHDERIVGIESTERILLSGQKINRPKHK